VDHRDAALATVRAGADKERPAIVDRYRAAFPMLPDDFGLFEHIRLGGSRLKIVCRQKTRSVTNGHDVDRVACDAINDPITSLKNLTVCVAVVFTEPAANGRVRGQ
jgi:hypothetical protein